MRIYEIVDSLEEKWSERYKRSIDCQHPRGFSQRAHCAGRKKHMREWSAMEMAIMEGGHSLEDYRHAIEKHKSSSYKTA